MSVELIEKLESNESSDFFLFKILRAHILPLTNCAFNKSGDKFITGSYDRTCKVWNTISGDELLTLEGHRNVVYAIAFNNPYGDKIITGSFGTYEFHATSSNYSVSFLLQFALPCERGIYIIQAFLLLKTLYHHVIVNINSYDILFNSAHHLHLPNAGCQLFVNIIVNNRQDM